MKSKLFIVGSGAGRGLITLRGIEALNSSDVVLYDALVSQDIVQLINKDKIFVGKKGFSSHSIVQDEINEYLRVFLSQGKTVARLKGGDPAIFGRLSDEIDLARNMGVEIEIIPGVTTASYFSAILSQSLTSRYVSSGVVFITGHSNKKDLRNLHNWRALVELKYTIVVYMAAKTICTICELLTDNGLDPETPIAAGESLGGLDERVSIFSVKDILKNDKEFSSPVIFIIGDVIKIIGDKR
ncbi:MAG: uroporphyrinogen-III C-methyltransferase [Calditerrivibrio sp.]|nr:uroporphyrinogen-III C-methyltransferase [Calditerrivibrio sp.]MCA1932714.1 uroporphyrinogen-III C-methyltransferase [Calditerrivibrio sp.]